MKSLIGIVLTLFGLAGLAAVIGLGAGVYNLISQIGAERLWQMLFVVILCGFLVVILWVTLSGLAKIAEAQRAGMPERHFYHDTKTERHTTHTIDARPPAPVQLPGLPEPSSMAIFPAMIGAAWRQGIEAGGEPAEVIDGEKRDLEPARRVWQ